MPTDINSGDFEKMQEQAIKRVQEMKQKAGTQRRTEQEFKHGESPQGKNFHSSAMPRPNEQQGRREIERQPSQKMPPEPPKPPQENLQKSALSDSHKIISSLFNLDNDMSMLLPLLLLLKKEDADELLIMALLYVMS